MATAICMPKLGMTMREGRLVSWPVQIGDFVEKGSVVLLIESEKAEVDIEATASGYLRHIYVDVDETVPCGTLLAALTETMDEDFDVEAFRAANDRPETVPSPGPAVSTARPPAAVAPADVGQPRARRPVAPAARARARELGIDLEAVTGTGPGGRVTRADVDAWAASRASLVKVADGVALEVPEDGQGDVVLFLPGFGTDASSFAAQSAALATRYRVRAMNPRGIGASDPGGCDPITPKTVAGDAARLLDGATHVVGASFGAAAAACLAIERPDLVRSLVLVTPSLAPNPRLFAVLAAWARLVGTAPAETVATSMLPWLFSSRCLADDAVAKRTVRGFAAMTARTPGVVLERYLEGLRAWAEGPAPDLHRIAAPTLVLEADEDLLTPGAADVAAAIPGASLVVVKEAGHALALEDPDEVTRAIEEHIATA